MGLLAFLNLEVTEIGAFAVSCLLGYFAGTLAPQGTLAIFTTLLVAYHLFLAWLVFGSRYRIAVPSSMIAMLVTHVCCLVLVAAPVMMARNVVPFFDVFRYAMIGLALFERSWLFSGSDIRQPAKPELVMPEPRKRLTPKQLMPKAKVAAPPAATTAAAEPQFSIVRTGQALDAWEHHMARQRPGTREYDLWMRERRRAERRHAATH